VAEIARLCGIEVPNARVIKSMDRDVLLIERFDRRPGGRQASQAVISREAST